MKIPLRPPVSFDMESTAQNSIELLPPKETTRLMPVDRASILSSKYGLLNKEEGEAVSVVFETANGHFEKEPDGKKSSKLMVKDVERGPTAMEDPEAMSKSVELLVETVFDISGGRRAFIEAEEAEQVLKPLKEPGSKYTKICFSNRSFGLNAANVAVPILSSLKNQLMEVDLSDFIAGRAEAEALEVMSMFSSALEGCELRYLNLSNNALGEKGVRAFGKLLKSQGNLEEIYLMNDGISEEAAKAVFELIPSSKKLTILHFHNNMTGDEGAIAISRLVKESPMLVDFRCSSTRVGAEGGVALAEALGTCNHLKKLDLRDNMFGVKVGFALSKCISVFADLTEVYLSYLNLEDEGTIALANALRNSAPSLEILEMAGNDITSKAAPALAACVTAKKYSLAKLNLSENELKDQGSLVIAKALEEEFGRLIEVDMSTNAIRRAGARLLAQAVVGKPGFKLLNINGNFLSDEGVEDVKEIFKNAPGVLWPLDDNDPEGEEYEEDADEDGGGDDDVELVSKLQGLEIKQEQ